MSSLCMAPSVAAAYAKDELIAIFTANSTSLEPMRSLIKEECGIDPEDKRFVIVGCQDVPIFGKAVADGLRQGTAGVSITSPHIIRLNEEAEALLSARASTNPLTLYYPYSKVINYEQRVARAH